MNWKLVAAGVLSIAIIVEAVVKIRAEFRPARRWGRTLLYGILFVAVWLTALFGNPSVGVMLGGGFLILLVRLARLTRGQEPPKIDR